MPKRYTDRDLAIIRNQQGENIPVPPARKPRSNDESRIQRAFVIWWRNNCAGLHLNQKLLHSIPNGGFRSVVTASIMKAEGQERGVFDMKLNVARSGKHGLWLEVKTKTGRLSEEQADFLAAVEEQGYAAVVCRSFDECVEAVLHYLKP